MGKYDGKRLLVLGSNVGATDIVRYARSQGAEVIVADYYPPERSEAKRYADRHYLTSTADLGALDKIIHEEGISGVIAGISEFNLLKAMALCEQNGLPFYCTKAQWDTVESKELFRALCEQSGVPCPKTYFSGKELPDSVWESLCYPLVLKPVDASASSGVFICHSEEELRRRIPEAAAFSAKGVIIIEEFVRGNEFTAHYTISGGKAALACIDNRYPVALHEGTVTTIPIARIYPSVFAEEYIDRVNESVIRMCESIGMQDGILFVQGIHNPETGDFRIFEAGLRCAGEAPYRFLQQITGDSFIRIIVDHALLGQTDYDLSCEKPLLDGKCCGIVSFAAHHGMVGSITGLDCTDFASLGVLSYENRYPVGREVPDTDTLRQLNIRFVMLTESRAQMADCIRQINARVSVFNTDGACMVEKFDPERIWNEL